MMDADGDGYGANTASAVYDPGSDCDDGDSRVNPSQSGYFSTPSYGTGTFDYNCDGSLEKQWTDYGSCDSWGSSIGDCTLGDAGWHGSVPGCGQDGAYLVDNDSCSASCHVLGIPFCCDESGPSFENSRTQACH